MVLSRHRPQGISLARVTQVRQKTAALGMQLTSCASNYRKLGADCFESCPAESSVSVLVDPVTSHSYRQINSLHSPPAFGGGYAARNWQSWRIVKPRRTANPAGAYRFEQRAKLTEYTTGRREVGTPLFNSQTQLRVADLPPDPSVRRMNCLIGAAMV
jgi:hypothetical protein